jgi:hypothetical protein
MNISPDQLQAAPEFQYLGRLKSPRQHFAVTQNVSVDFQ